MKGYEELSDLDAVSGLFTLNLMGLTGTEASNLTMFSKPCFNKNRVKFYTHSAKKKKKKIKSYFRNQL